MSMEKLENKLIDMRELYDEMVEKGGSFQVYMISFI